MTKVLYINTDDGRQESLEFKDQLELVRYIKCETYEYAGIEDYNPIIKNEKDIYYEEGFGLTHIWIIIQ